MTDPAAMVTTELRADEVEFLKLRARCSACGHLFAIHGLDSCLVCSFNAARKK